MVEGRQSSATFAFHFDHSPLSQEEIQGYLPKTTIAEGAMVYEHILNAFFDEVEALSSVKPYMVSPGNHEANCDNGGTTNKTSGQVSSRLLSQTSLVFEM